MNSNLNPRERILKEVRSSLVSVRDRNSATNQVATVAKSIDENQVINDLKNSIGEHSKLFICHNKYHFIDQIILFLEKSRFNKFICNDKKLKGFFNSCGLQYVEDFDEIDSNTISIFIADYFEPNGLFTSFNYNGFSAKAISLTENLAIVSFRDTLVKNSKLLFERIKNRVSDKDLVSVQLLNIVDNEAFGHNSQKVSFIINSR